MDIQELKLKFISISNKDDAINVIEKERNN